MLITVYTILGDGHRSFHRDPYMSIVYKGSLLLNADNTAYTMHGTKKKHCLVRLYAPLMLFFLTGKTPLWHWHNIHLPQVIYKSGIPWNRLGEFEDPKNQKSYVMCCLLQPRDRQRYSITDCPVVSGCMKDASLCLIFAVQRCLSGQDPYVFPCGGLNMHLPAIHLIFDFDSILWGWPSLEVSCLLRTHNVISRKLIT